MFSGLGKLLSERQAEKKKKKKQRALDVNMQSS